MAEEEVLRTIAFTIVRATSFVSNAVIFGSALIALVVLRPSFAELPEKKWEEARTRAAGGLERIIQAALWASFAATALAILLQTLLLSELAGGRVDGSSLNSVLETQFGRWHLARLPLLVALAVLLVGRVRRLAFRGLGDPISRRHSIWWWAWAGLGLGLLATSSLSGHARISSPAALTVANDLVHLAAGATWFAGVVALGALLPRCLRRCDPLDRLRLSTPLVMRFSEVALAAIATILGTGIIASLVNVGSPDDLIDSAYGRALLTKIGLFVMILALGGVNHVFVRRRLRRALEKGTTSPAQSLFRKTIAVELAVGLVVMGVTGLLVGSQRTRVSAPVFMQVEEP